MNVTILFGGTNKERLVSVASAQALCQALPEAELWFWAAGDSVHETDAKTLVEHARPFEHEFKPGGRRVGKSIEDALDQAAAQYRATVILACQNVADTLRALQADADALKANAEAARAAQASF